MNFKLVLINVSILLIMPAIQAQKGYTISPSNTLSVSVPSNNLSVYDIYMNNTTGGTIYLKWKKISIDLPSGWDYSLCDLGTCYALIPDSAQMGDVLMGDKGFLGFNIDPKSFGGTGIAKFYVYQAGKYGEGDTCTFIMSANGTGIKSISSMSGINVYPNPVKSMLNLSSSAGNNKYEVRITDASGRIVSEVVISSSFESIDVSSFDNGLYFIQITRDNLVFYDKFTKL